MTKKNEDNTQVSQYRRAWLEAVGRQLAAERKRLGLSQADMADKLGVSSRTVGYIESGENNNFENLLSYCYETGADFFTVVARAKVILQANEISEDALLGLLNTARGSGVDR